GDGCPDWVAPPERAPASPSPHPGKWAKTDPRADPRSALGPAGTTPPPNSERSTALDTGTSRECRSGLFRPSARPGAPCAPGPRISFATPAPPRDGVSTARAIQPAS